MSRAPNISPATDASAGLGDESLAAYYAIERPKTRAECRDEERLKIPREIRPKPRTCPWVGCKHHLLLEVTAPTKIDRRDDSRATSIRINRRVRGERLNGRAPGLRASDARHVFERWCDDALEALQNLPYSCALDVVDDFPDGVKVDAIGYLFGFTRQAALAEVSKVENLRDDLRAHAPDDAACAIELAEPTVALLETAAQHAGITTSNLLDALIVKALDEAEDR